ncbi:MAG: (Fe-S)-binding protein [Anaerolineae bacterium]|nr:(Fe-S)-binding protein [Anaerolineae bacterium]
MITPSPPTVQFFITCLLDSLFPDVAQDVVTVLEQQGVRVEIPRGQTCCGQPAYNAGFWPEARSAAATTLTLLHQTAGPIVIASGSCAAMIKHHYQELFQDDPAMQARVREVSGRVVEFSQYLVDHLAVTDVGATLKRKIVYHPSCHGVRELGLSRQPYALLQAVNGIELCQQDKPQTCCGFGGLFAIKMAPISGAMMNERLEALQAAGADLIVGGDISCLMHLEGGLRKQGSPMRTCHLATVLANRGA